MKYLVTSALPYINGIKHLGNLAGSMLPADVYSRFLRQSGKEVLYICATDDHGTPAEIAAHEMGLSVEDFCDRQHELQKEIYERFGLAFDHFGRTSRQQNIDLTQLFAEDIIKNGYAEIRSMRQIYSVADQRFLPDRYVVGTCPKCSYENARGDQCENCTTVLDPTELINPRSAISGSSDLEVRETNHLFLLLSKLAPEVRAWVDQQKDWPHLVSSIAYKWLDEGLHDRCITRDLKWGVPTKVSGLEEKVFYVWFDAPIGYIAATKEWADAKPDERDWKEYWLNADNVRYVQFMAKDNIPFHTVSFPASEIATGKPWKKVDYLKGFNWLNYYGGKFSTSQKRGVFTSDALDILPADYWRYYLLARSPEGSDSTFTWPDLQTAINKDLGNVFGNFINRILKFSKSKFGDQVPPLGEWSDTERKYIGLFQEAVDNYTSHMEEINFRKSIEALRQIWVLGNEYLVEAAPWTVFNADPDRSAVATNFAFNVIRIMTVLSKPIIPFTSEKIGTALGFDTQGWIKNIEQELKYFLGGTDFNIPELLFKKLEDDEILSLEQRFSGSIKPSEISAPNSYPSRQIT